MKDKINRLARGIIDAETPEIRLMPEQFSDALSQGGVRRFSIDLESPDGSNLKGLCYCDHPRISLETRVFVGRRSHISFCADASACEPDTQIFGNINLITNAGEYEVPFTFTVTQPKKKLGEYTGTIPVLNTEADTKAPAAASEETVSTAKAASQKAGSAKEAAQAASAYLDFLASNFPEDDELLGSLCVILIEEDRKDPFSFALYREAVLRDLGITMLYEAYAGAFPKDSDEAMPRQILLYFSYDNNLPQDACAAVYRDVLLHVDPASELYRIYEPQIRDFTLKCLFEGRMDERLAVLYSHMLYPDMIDRNLAKRLPDLLKSCSIVPQKPGMRSLLIHYPELTEEERYQGKDGAFYAPVYFDNAEIAFEDAYGRRFSGCASKKPLMQEPALLKRCFELAPAHPMLKLSAAKEILAGGIHTETQKEIIKDVLKSLPLAHAMQEALIHALCAYGGAADWLTLVNLDEVSFETKRAICSLLIREGQDETALGLLKRLGLEAASAEEQAKLASALIQSGKAPVTDGEADPFFLSLCKSAFNNGADDPALLAFMTQYYENCTEDMYAVMLAAEKALAPLHDLPEKILVAKLFSGVRTHIDETFVRYVRCCRQQEVIVRAYFTVRANDYFVEGREDVARETFEALFSYISAQDAPEKLPTVYLLAWTRYEAGRAQLSADEKALCQKLTDLLIEEKLVFYYTKQLRKKIDIPEAISERYYIEYRGNKERPPRLMIRFGTDAFRQEEMTRVYQGIYLWSTILFLTDELHYAIYDDAISALPVQEGMIAVKKLHKGESGRFELLNRMTGALEARNLPALKEEMQNYLLQEKMNRALFTVGE